MSEKKESTHLTKRFFTYAGATVVGLIGVFSFAYFVLPTLLSFSFVETATVASTEDNINSLPTTTPPVVPEVVHLPTPEPVRAVYMSQCVAGTVPFRNSLVKFIDKTELNAVVIDIRDYSGKISFPTDDPILKDSVSSACGANDMKSFIKTLHEKGIYVIGRITTFQNPYYSSLHPEEAVQKEGGGVWKDYKGLSFVDVGAKNYWDSVVELGKISYALGFDELNFDYIRFPSDGPMKEAVYSWDTGRSKPEALEEFFKYLTDNLRPTGAVLSADLFGMVTVNEDDLGIGQVLERALPYFDFIDPMVYPSHYPTGYNGYSNVNDHPYEIVKVAMDTAVARTLSTTTTIASLAYTPIIKTRILPAHGDVATTSINENTGVYEKPAYPPSKIRPWLQSFDYPVVYTPEMVEAQIKAMNDAGLDSYLVWDAANKYNALRQVLTATSTTP